MPVDKKKETFTVEDDDDEIEVSFWPVGDKSHLNMSCDCIETMHLFICFWKD